MEAIADIFQCIFGISFRFFWLIIDELTYKTGKGKQSSFGLECVQQADIPQIIGTDTVEEDRKNQYKYWIYRIVLVDLCDMTWTSAHDHIQNETYKQSCDHHVVDGNIIVGCNIHCGGKG